MVNSGWGVGDEDNENGIIESVLYGGCGRNVMLGIIQSETGWQTEWNDYENFSFWCFIFTRFCIKFLSINFILIFNFSHPQCFRHPSPSPAEAAVNGNHSPQDKIHSFHPRCHPNPALNCRSSMELLTYSQLTSHSICDCSLELLVFAFHVPRNKQKMEISRSPWVWVGAQTDCHANQWMGWRGDVWMMSIQTNEDKGREEEEEAADFDCYIEWVHRIGVS